MKTTLLIITLLNLLVITDSFWNNLPVLITSIITAIISLIAAIKGHQNQKAIVQVEKNVNGKMQELVEVVKVSAKAEGVLESKNAAEKIEAAKNAGKLEGLQQQAKDEALKNMPPPIQ